jgi:tetratricopeptide (TPR) repeat protein
VARRDQAEKALAIVRKLRPYAGETYLTAATYYYNVHEPELGRPLLTLARQKLPNNWKVQFVTGTTGMIDGRWAESLSAMERARTLNPLHLASLSMLSIIDGALRRYDDAKKVTGDAMAAGINPDYFAMRHAQLVQSQTGDTSEYQTVFRRVAGQGPPSERTFVMRWAIALRNRDFDEAARVVAADPRQYFTGGSTTSNYPRAFFTGGIAYARGDLAAARKDYETVRPTLEEAVQKRPEDAPAWMALSDLDARLGRQEDAIREGEHAVSLLPISRDASQGPKVAVSLAWVYAEAGEKNRALAYLESLENVPNGYDYGYLSRDPDWDVLRGEPRFDAILQAIRVPVDLAKFKAADFGQGPPPAAP